MMPLFSREAKCFLGHSAWLVVGLATVMCAAQQPVRCLAEPQPAPNAKSAAWPGEARHLSFVWADARHPTELSSAERPAARVCRVSARGAAEYFADRQLKLAGGGFLVDSASSAAFCDRCRRTGILDVEFVLIPDEKQLADPAVVMGAFRRMSNRPPCTVWAASGTSRAMTTNYAGEPSDQPAGGRSSQPRGPWQHARRIADFDRFALTPADAT